MNRIFYQKNKNAVKMKNLIKAAKELNEKIGPDPAIKVVGVKKAKLEEELKEAALLIDLKEDDISDKTMEILNDIGAFAVADATEEDDPVEADPEDAPDPEEEEEEEEVDLVEEIDKAKKLKELKTLVKEFDEFKKLRNIQYFSVKELKEDMMGLIDPDWVPEEKAPPTEKKEPADKPEPKPAAKSKKGNTEKKVSNKGIVYLAWKEGQKDIETLHKLVSARVKLNTIKAWIGAWEKDKNLPANAK